MRMLPLADVVLWRWALPTCSLVYILLGMLPRGGMAIVCNYCYNADKLADCAFSKRTCETKQICFVDTSKVTYGAGTKKERTTFMYKMGCAYSSLCKDGISYGPGPQGYSRISRQCCCTDKCVEGDGSGKSKYDVCPWAMPNATDPTNDSPSTVSPEHWMKAWTAIPAMMSFIWGVITYLTS